MYIDNEDLNVWLSLWTFKSNISEKITWFLNTCKNQITVFGTYFSIKASSCFVWSTSITKMQKLEDFKKSEIFNEKIKR